MTGVAKKQETINRKQRIINQENVISATAAAATAAATSAATSAATAAATSAAAAVTKLLEKIEERGEENSNTLAAIDNRTTLHTDLLNDIRTNLSYLSAIANNTESMATSIAEFKNTTTTAFTNIREDNKPLFSMLTNRKSVPLSIVVMLVLLVGIGSLVMLVSVAQVSLWVDNNSLSMSAQHVTKEDPNKEVKMLLDQKKKEIEAIETKLKENN